jgi:tRNA G10  N-methylase Trm11
MSNALPALPENFAYRLDLAKHVTPRLMKDQPIHRWFYFPHSFSPQLVNLLFDEWQLPTGSVVIDPFVGAGTTLCTALQNGYSAIGTDISPLSIFVSNTKVRFYDEDQIRESLQNVISLVNQQEDVDIQRTERLQRAFTDAEFRELTRLRQAIFEQNEQIKDVFLLGLLRIQQKFSRAVPDGGWFRWRKQSCQAHKILLNFIEFIEIMVSDLIDIGQKNFGYCEAIPYDARQLNTLRQVRPDLEAGCQAIITSPPYPNRHDYSRIFQIELLTLGLAEQDIFTLRYESLRSHVEARPPIDDLPPFQRSERLNQALNLLPDDADIRIESMLTGYFEDMNAVLHATYDTLAPGGYIALVVGNVRHAGVMFPVDEILLSIGQTIGYTALTSWVARLRGNSAQQMGRYGREPARESILILQKPQ